MLLARCSGQSFMAWSDLASPGKIVTRTTWLKKNKLNHELKQTISKIKGVFEAFFKSLEFKTKKMLAVRINSGRGKT